MKKYILISPFILLAACATPREQCISQVTQDYRAALGAISVAQANITRGYAIHRQQVPYTYSGVCYYGATSYTCPKTGYRTQETPVPVDINEERKRLSTLNKLLPNLKKQADNGQKQCVLQHPEG